jgi:hypothetical protein
MATSEARSGSTRKTESAHMDGNDTAVPSAAKSPSAKKAPESDRKTITAKTVVI